MGQLIRAQAGVCAEASLHALVMLMHVTSEDVRKIRQKLAQFPMQSTQLADRFSEALLTITLGVGEPYWDVLAPQSRPQGLKNIPDYVCSEHPLPVTPFDLVMVIRSDRADANYLAGLQLLHWLDDVVVLAEQHAPFRCLDGRDLFGFKYMNEQMAGPTRRERTLISAAHDPEFAGGSFFWLFFSKQDVQRFSALTQAEQERIMGRDKLSGRIIKSNKEPSHADKTAGDLWRLHMPFGGLQRPQEMSLLFANQADVLDSWIRNRFMIDEKGLADPLLEFENVEHASAYFAPPLQWLDQLGGR